MKRETSLRRINVARRARRRASGVYSEYHRWIGEQPCLLAGREYHFCRGEVAGHHPKSVGAGGKDYANEIPLCQVAHTTIHTCGRWTFEMTWNVDLRAEAKRYATMWEERGQEEGF